MAQSWLRRIAIASLMVAGGSIPFLLQATSATPAGAATLTIDRPLPNARLLSQSSSISALEQAVHAQINQYRASRKLPPLTLDSRISAISRSHSQAMASGQVSFSHQGFEQRARAISQFMPMRGAAENIAYNQGYRNPDQQAVQGWLKSSGHRSNIEGRYTATGIGIAVNSKGEYYFTQIFINRR
ncbi:serine protease [Leptolyngbya sp. 'hensonii']|uniref:CAP domain-containing protein n=1 Tax=Leptolyngbya sp. 'hensonii' TaxID=1922337 RepID=UPI00094FCA2A|nr:CAP domain-containing protein [Leptolyngbya sp. 'hensonii']OLP15425.1 serine protease [Leptolyngbya sp. 'hensonii']